MDDATSLWEVASWLEGDPLLTQRSVVIGLVACLAAVIVVGSFSANALSGHAKEHDIDCRAEVDTLSTGDETTVTCTVFEDATAQLPTNVVQLDVAGVGSDIHQTDQCSMPGGSRTCEVEFTYTRNARGRDTVTAWLDDTGPDGPVDEPVDPPPGSQLSHNDTDVLARNWFIAGTTLACADASSGAQGDRKIRCTVSGPVGTPPSAFDGTVVDAENLSGSNDPDNSADDPADFNNSCTVAAGTCTLALRANEEQTGAADVCLWIDHNGNNAFRASGSQFDGGRCEAEQGSPATNYTEVVEVVWSSKARQSTVSLRHSLNPHKFSGSVGSPSSACRGGRRVMVFKVRGGPDLQVARKNTATNGTWSRRHKTGGAGTYYAVAPAVTVASGGFLFDCGRAESAERTVNR